MCQHHWSNWAPTSPYKEAIDWDAAGRPTKYCSYTCTPSGINAMSTYTGVVDRLFEALAEISYGQLHFSWDVGVTDTLYMPASDDGSGPFMYTDAPVHPFLKQQGIDASKDYHTIVVRPCLGFGAQNAAKPNHILTFSTL